MHWGLWYGHCQQLLLCNLFLTASWLVVLIMSKLSNAPDWTESHFLIHHYCLSLLARQKEELLSLNILICH